MLIFSCRLEDEVDEGLNFGIHLLEILRRYRYAPHIPQIDDGIAILSSWTATEKLAHQTYDVDGIYFPQGGKKVIADFSNNMLRKSFISLEDLDFKRGH